MLACLFSHHDMSNDKLLVANNTGYTLFECKQDYYYYPGPWVKFLPWTQRANELTFASDEEEGKGETSC